MCAIRCPKEANTKLATLAIVSGATLLMLSDRKVRADNCCMQKHYKNKCRKATTTNAHTHTQARIESSKLRKSQAKRKEKKTKTKDSVRISANCSKEYLHKHQDRRHPGKETKVKRKKHKIPCKVHLLLKFIIQHWSATKYEDFVLLLVTVEYTPLPQWMQGM